MKSARFSQIKAQFNLAWLAIPLVIVGSEALAWWWNHPPSSTNGQRLLSYQFPVDSEKSTLAPLKKDVVEILSCDQALSGWIETDEEVLLSVNYFEWNDIDQIGLAHAFKHQPETCMGNVGNQIKAYLPERVLKLDQQNLVFDATQFEDSEKKPLYIFKLSWAEGMEGVNILRAEKAARRFKFQCATRRWFPRYARVLMVGVYNAKSESQAWEAVQEKLLPDVSFSQNHAEKP